MSGLSGKANGFGSVSLLSDRSRSTTGEPAKAPTSTMVKKFSCNWTLNKVGKLLNNPARSTVKRFSNKSLPFHMRKRTNKKK